MKSFIRELINTRLLPKSGQLISYADYDDGWYEKGWWQGRVNSNNLTRYVPQTLSGDDIVIDKATGLMWAADGNAAGCNNGNTIAWAAALTYAEALNFAGYTDWRLPNVKELISLVEYDANLNPNFIDALFTLAGSAYQTATVAPNNTTRVLSVQFQSGAVLGALQGMVKYMRAVRDMI